MDFFALAWLIPLFPLLAFTIIILFTRPMPRISSNLAIGALFLSMLLGLGALFQALGNGHPDSLMADSHHVYTWFPTGNSTFNMGWIVDPLSAVALGMVTVICLMIFIYSQGYIGAEVKHLYPQDPSAQAHRYSQFFAYISLFTTGMLGLVISDNLLMLFIFWEIMGLCSYLLIGFWFERPSAANAAVKAFITTRVGDVILLLGLVFLYTQSHSLDFVRIFSEANLQALAQPNFYIAGLGLFAPSTLIALLIFGGAAGKSAQFPLHVWLPDAMEGPTPVSALIHAATMVAAGVFLVARMFPIYSAAQTFGNAPSSSSLMVVAFIGAFTALFAATIGIAQNDIKRVLAYSTISQLGYMFLALGIGAYVAAVFHLITHAFFKALLFLGSGSVIHGMEHGIEHTSGHGHAAESHSQHEANPQDMQFMGGLRHRMPVTFWTFLIGMGALAGIPPLAGFWSKDEILSEAFQNGHMVIWAVGTIAAFLTAFYMSRQIFLVFFGAPRHPAADAAVESPVSMIFPLGVLAVFAALLGFVGMPENISPWGNPFHAFVGHVFEAGVFNPLVAGISVLMAVLGIGAGWLLYGRKPLVAGQRDPLTRLGPIWALLKNKYYIDEIYGFVFGRGVNGLARLSDLFDRYVVDGIVRLIVLLGSFSSNAMRFIDRNIVDSIGDLVAVVGQEFGAGLSRIQTGRAQNYLLVVGFSLALLLVLYLFTGGAG